MDNDSTKFRLQKHIPKDLHSSRLLCFLHPNNFETEECKQTASLLHKICFAALTDFHESELINDLILDEKEKDIVILNYWKESENIEVKARSCDVLRRFEKDKRKITVEASDNYFEAYSEFKEIEFLIRAVSVRKIKTLNDDIFLNKILSIINEDIYPYWLNKLIIALLNSYSLDRISILIPFAKEQIAKAIIANDFIRERQFIDVLFSLKGLNKDELHKQLALSFESEADKIANNKKPNTYYPNLPDIYQDAYNEIFKIKEKEPEIHNRIQEKLVKEKKLFVETLSIYGIKKRVEVPPEFKKQIDDSVKNIIIVSFFDLIKLLLVIPFTSIENITRYESICRKASPLSTLFGQHNQLNNKGNTIGNAESEKSLKTEAHVYYRQWKLYAMWTYVSMAAWAKIKIDSNTVYLLLKKNKPEFIEVDSLILWEKGITAGLNKDFITASHILMPQLEHALHNMAENANGTITSLENKRQEEPTLGKILPLLKMTIEEEILFEIESFLQSGIDVNFRNNLSHGLFSTFEIDKHGIYLWWLCLKIYFCKDYFQIK